MGKPWEASGGFLPGHSGRSGWGVLREWRPSRLRRAWAGRIHTPAQKPAGVGGQDAGRKQKPDPGVEQTLGGEGQAGYVLSL